MKVGIPRESATGECRVAATPKTAKRIREKLGFEVAIESGAGAAAGYTDEAYREVGVEIVDRAQAFGSEIVLMVEAPKLTEVPLLRDGGVLIAFLFPARSAELLDALKAQGVSALSMDMVPRITRAQKLDALSSMANIAGYRAVIEAAHSFGSFFPSQFTAAGKVPPAKVLVIGAGVAGLAAIAAARSLGAVVRAFDTRPAVRDEVKSLGGEFLEVELEEEGDGGGGYARVMSKAFIEAEMALFRAQAPELDVVITTALVPGKKAPTLWTRDMVEAMKPGSVIVDLAAAQGGNCEITEADKSLVHEGVHVLGLTDLTSRMAPTASQLYGTNLYHMLDELGGAEGFDLDLDNIVIRTSLVTHQGELTYPPPPPPEPTPQTQKKEEAPKPAEAEAAPKAAPKKGLGGLIFGGIGLALAALWLYLMVTSESGTTTGGARELLQHMTVFVLAVFVGWQVIWNVTPALHTPLMSVTNAISGIIIVGGILEGARSADLTAPIILGLVAAFVATINIAGGFLVTHRMLAMFHQGTEGK